VLSSRSRLSSRPVGVSLLAGAALTLAACGAAAPGASLDLGGPCARHGSAVAAPCGATSPSPTGVPQFRHIVVVAFDGKSYSQVIGNSSAPFFSSLAAGGADFTQSFAEASPGQPDYLALFSGSTQGVTSDSCPLTFTGPNLGADLIAAGHTFTGYAEDLPAAGSAVCTSGNYARAHAPWTDFPSVPASASQPFTAFPGSSDFNALPAVSLVIPNVCHSMTTCSVGSGNAWLENRLGAYANWTASNDSLLIVTFGGNDGSAGDQIPTIVYGANVRPGTYREHVSHYTVLRTIEEAYGLPFDGAAASAAPITDIWTGVSASPGPSISPSSSASPSGPAVAMPAFRHIVLVIFENRGYGEVIGNSSAPYFNQLAARGANFTDFVAITHPSQPNYLALFSGSTQGTTSDSCPHTFATPNLAQGLIAAGKTFTGYVDALPAAGATVCTSGNYARKHVPWVNFSNVPASATESFTRFPQTASASFSALPDFSFVVPDLCDDMHNCSVAVGDTWLSAHLGAYATWAKANDSLLIVTFDENDGAAGNIVPTIFAGAHVRPGNYSEHVTHYSTLRAIEAEYGLPYDGAAASAAPITGIWTTGS
jgi:Phosphoesterase family